MSIGPIDLNHLLNVAKKAATNAGAIIRSADCEQRAAQFKEAGATLASQVVTKIDLKAQASILETLAKSTREFDLGLLTEEAPDDGSRFKKEYFWCIDPLDGTLNFSEARAGYSTSIALVSHKGETIIGVVYDPLTDSLYHALKGSGAFKNERPFKASQNTTKTRPLIITKGAAVMNALLTIESAPAIFYKKPKAQLGGGSLWDFAATSLIHAQAGGINTDYQHTPINFNRKTTTFMNDLGVIFASDASLLSYLN